MPLDILRAEVIELSSTKVLAKREKKRKVPEERQRQMWEVGHVEAVDDHLYLAEGG